MNNACDAEEADLEDVLSELREAMPSEASTDAGRPACICKDGTEIR